MNNGSRLCFRDYALIIIVTMVLHLPSLFGGLYLDDAMNYLNASRTGWNIEELCKGFNLDISRLHSGIVPSFINHHVRYFRPLMVISMKMDQFLWNDNFNLYHLLSFATVLITVLLVAILGFMITGSATTARIGALLFAAAPVNLFTSYWLSSRTDLLCGLFMILSLVLFCMSAGKGRFISSTSLASLAAFGLALASKEATVTLPLMIPLLWFHFRISSWDCENKNNSDMPEIDIQRSGWKSIARKSLIVSLPYFAILAAYIPLRQWAVAGSGLPRIHFYMFPPEDPLFIFYALERLFLSLSTLILALPPVPIKMLFSSPSFHGSVLIMAIVCGWWFKGLLKKLNTVNNQECFNNLKAANNLISADNPGHSKPCKPHPLLLFAVLWFIASLPSLPLFPAPHYHYVPSIFTSLAIGWFIASVRCSGSDPRWGRGYLIFIGLTSLTAASLVTAFFSSVEKHNSRLFRDMAALHKGRVQKGRVQKNRIPKDRGGNFNADGNSVTSADKSVPAEPTEFYVFDPDHSAAHAFSELQVREHINNFRVFLVDVGTPISGASRIRVLPDRVIIKAKREPLWTGILVLFACPDRYRFLDNETFSCPFHTLKVVKAGKNRHTGLWGAEILEILFPDGKSEREGRFFIHAPPLGPPVILHVPANLRQPQS
ncbi:MAG: hypothetical protein CVV64_14135 [Candidatus Wallbacteria bacterium HGW-Wallbacteria-1]|uniref:Glycosyltransferase RgtA/B/C/D-like domain-containing protein n=1 Tax=Candidatus Wallbacteria bacterium HGW-Wallbacteria-1 TaxID=2013854 RepID=A0A2N1PMN0_9BACT|nr:MAG: hypothetical protein CVV64_14135 [Candidatus Wallbacteria bacterium HGW-Wallbacteria-1]